MAPAVRLEHVHKNYRLVRQRPFLAKEVVRRFMQRKTEVEEYPALVDVTFDVEKSDCVAVVGTNGSGKSTLLSLIARTIYPTAGMVEVNGVVGPLLELGAGFHPDLTGYENVFLNASLLGYSREQVEAKLEDIIEFSGLRSFIHAPVRTYSTGMVARLGFSVVAHLDPDILLMDEVLSVGDAEFQVRCERTLRGFIEAGKTLILVSHNVETVLRICRSALWLDRGRLAAAGPAREVCEAYQRAVAGAEAARAAGTA